MKKKHLKTRHALLMSCISLMTCFAMLFGATFAWFTDSVTSGVNRIVSGNLDVELYHKNNETADTKVDGMTKLFNVAADGYLWEPEAMAYETFEIRNEGTLALKYQLALVNAGNNTVTRDSTTKSLLDVIKVAVINDATNGITRELIKTNATMTLKDFIGSVNNTSGTLYPSGSTAGDTTKTFTVALYWPQSEGDNFYNLKDGKLADDNGKELYVDLGITLVATQLQNESDSFDNTYDANAEYPSAVAYTINDSASKNVTNYSDSNGTDSALTIASSNATSTIPASTKLTSLTKLDDTGAETTETATSLTAAAYDLSREIKTTENSSNSVTYDISYNATVTTTTTGENPTTTTDTYAVHEFSNIVTNVLNVGTGLLNVSVTHGGVAMNKLTTGGVPAEPNENGDFYYDAGTGKLYIYSKTYSEYKVSFEQAEVSVKIDNATTNMTLAAFRDGVNDGTYANATVTLLRNVNLGGAEWTPIGTNEHPFSGVFDGNGKTISGLTINSANDYVALFGYIQGTATSFTKDTPLSNFYDTSYTVTLPDESSFGCEVKNLTVSNANVTTTGKYAAAVVANCADATIKNVTVTGSTSMTSMRSGGVVAFVPDNAVAFIDSCTTESGVTVTATQYHAAGILARVDGILSRVIISNCTNNATISSAGVNAGGITGQAKYTLIYSCTNNGNVTGGTRSAGITTDSSGSVIINCLNTGSITSSKAGTKSDESTAGIYAYAATTGTNIVVNCTNTGSVTANCSDSAIVSGIMGGGADTGDKILNCVNKGTLTNLASSGLVYDISSLSKTETSVAPTDLSALNAELAKGNKNIKITSSLDLTSTDCTIAPRAQEYITFDHTPGYLTIDMTNVQPSSLAITVNNTTINVTGNSAKSLNIIGEGNKITTNGNDLKLANLTVTNNSGNQSTISVSSPAVRLALGGTGKVEATVTSGTTIDKVNFSGTGTYTLNNYGTISHNDNGTGNQHTVSTIVACNITVNNHGTIAAIGNSYALLFYNGCTVVVNEYTGSSCSSDKMWSKYATSNGATVTFNPCTD